MKMGFFQYWKMRFLYGKRHTKKWEAVYKMMDELDELERSLKGVAHTGENKMKKP